MLASPRRAMRPLMLGIASALALMLLLVACGEPDPQAGSGGSGDSVTPTPTTPASPSPQASPTAEAIEHPTGADDLVLKIEITGGLVPVGRGLTEMPVLSLYGDGRVITQGPQIAIFPPPALPNLRVTTLTEDGIQAVLQEAKKAGLMEGDKEYGLDGVADAQTTIFTVNAGGQTSVVSAYALGLDAPTADIPADEQEARQKLWDFLQQTQNLTAWLPASAIVSADEPYEIERLQVIAQPADKALDGDPGITPQTKEWPLETPLASFGEAFEGSLQGARCGVVEGDDLDPMLQALEGTNTLTRWESEGEQWVLYLRPLLPGEEGCAADRG